LHTFIIYFQQNLLKQAHDLDADENFALIFQLVRKSPCSPDQMKSLMNVIRKQGNVQKKPVPEAAVKAVKDDEVDGEACEQPNPVVSGAPSTSKTDGTCTKASFLTN